LVCAGLFAAGLGTDTGGAVRLPAAFCGCVGLNTSIGLVSRTGVTPLSETLDTVGPLAATVELAAQMLAAMQGSDLDDPTTIEPVGECPLRHLEKGISGLRFGRIKAESMPTLSSEVSEAFEIALDQLQESGATFGNCTLPMPFDEYQRIGGLISATEAYATYADIVDDTSAPMAEPNRQRMARGKTVSAAERIRIERDRARSIREFDAVIDGFDAIVLPTTPFTAIPVSDVDESDMSYGSHTRFVNFLELAGLAVPMSLTPVGLPTSLQIVVRRFDDPLALRIGRAFEEARGAFPKPRLHPN
ncbi:MAG: amidase, partial [Hyphomicrobiaceae bacterium]